MANTWQQEIALLSCYCSSTRLLRKIPQLPPYLSINLQPTSQKSQSSFSVSLIFIFVFLNNTCLLILVFSCDDLVLLNIFSCMCILLLPSIILWLCDNVCFYQCWVFNSYEYTISIHSKVIYFTIIVLLFDNSFFFFALLILILFLFA